MVITTTIIVPWIIAEKIVVGKVKNRIWVNGNYQGAGLYDHTILGLIRQLHKEIKNNWWKMTTGKPQ